MIPSQTILLEWIDTLTEVSFIHQTSHLAMHSQQDEEDAKRISKAIERIGKVLEKQANQEL